MPVYPDTQIAPGDPGSLLDKTYTYEFRSLLFGSGTDYVTTQVEGLLSLPGVEDMDTDKANDHGSFPGMLRMGKRIFVFDMTITGQAGVDIESKLAVARRTFQLPRRRDSRVLETFAFWRPGQPKMMAKVRCTRRDFPSNFNTARGLAAGSVELTAPDPLIYSIDTFQTTITVVGGTGSETIQMNGDYQDGYWPELHITGPVTTALIENEADDNRVIRLDLSLGPADTADVNVEREIVWINGVRSASAVRSDNQWWAILPGQNPINYVRQGGTDDSSVTITHKDVWQ